MLVEKIDGLIADALKQKDNEKLSVLRLIKNELVKKEKDGVELTEAVEANILTKMVAQREDSIKQFESANRQDLVQKEVREKEIIMEFAPKMASDDEIEAKTKEVISEMMKERQLTMKDMKSIMSVVQETYPTANGKIISKVLKSVI